MKYNFDEIIDRQHTNSVKVERCMALFGTTQVLPLWVADMDFRTPDFVIQAISKRCEHPIFGYSMMPKNFFSTLIQWIYDHHQWVVNPQWVGFIPGIVPGLSFAIQTFTELGDEVIIQPPVYYPFMDVIRKNERNLVFNPLKTVDGKFEMDFEALEKCITSKSKLLILCNPHNPGGRVWDKATLVRLAELCARHSILVLSDEIHADMAFEDFKHIPFATVSALAEQNSITYMSPTKTFNMPGLISASYIVPNEQIRNKLRAFLEKSELTGGNIFAYEATTAAYTYGEAWRKQMLTYVQHNIDYVVHFLATNIPQIVPMIPQASFLIWLNCKELGFETDDLHHFMSHKAGLGLNKGTVFGEGGEYHVRINVACSHSILVKAMNQLLTAVDGLKK
jgi:cystathionine beta-lyase